MKPIDGCCSLEQQLLDLSPDSLRRQIVKRDRPAQLARLVVERQLESRRELDRAQHAQAVVAERLVIDDAKDSPGKIATTIEGILVLAGQRIPRDGVDGEVATACGFLDRHRWITADLESLVAPSALRFAAGERHVDVADGLVGHSQFVDRKAAADGFHSAELLEQRRQPVFGDAEDLEVDVQGLLALGFGLWALGSGLGSLLREE